MAATKVTLKLLVDKTGKKVLFAEAGKDFVDFLFSILALPLGTVIRLLSPKKMAGCLGNLYESIENLNSTYMQPNQSKDSVLKPQAPHCGAQVPLLLPEHDSQPPPPSSKRNLYRCNSQRYGDCRSCVTEDPKQGCPHCNSLMNSQLTYVGHTTLAQPSHSSSPTICGEGGFVKEVVTYMVMDDLVVKPMSTISSITLLNHFQVKDLGSLEEKVMDVGMEEGMELLRASLQSKTVLTDIFFLKK